MIEKADEKEAPLREASSLMSVNALSWLGTLDRRSRQLRREGTVTSNTTLHRSYSSADSWRLILRQVEIRRSLLLLEGRPEACSGQQPHHSRDARAALADRAAPEHRNPLAPGPPSPRQRCTSAPARANQPRHRT